MKELQNKKILLGLTGSIATYKAPMLVRELVKLGADVHCVITPSAEHFVSSMVLANLSNNVVANDMFSKDVQNSGAWHIHLARECDAMLIAPCSAATLGKIAHGIADNALVTVATALPTEIPLLISPAMDTNMWQNPITQSNCNILVQKLNAIIIPPSEGELSSGLVGPGRFPEINVIIDYLLDAINSPKSPVNDYDVKSESNNLDSTIDDNWRKSINYEEGFLKEDLKGKKVLITAGPTHEKIDDVRYIANYSTGKMGYALAEEASARGADVILISGPVSLTCSSKINRINVVSAEDMFQYADKVKDDVDIAIFAAAVADFSPDSSVIGKIKKEKSGGEMVLNLRQTRDILGSFGENKAKGQFLVGFALEYANEKEYGRSKLKNKNCDMMILNSGSKLHSGFGGDNNTISILTKDLEKDFPPMPKTECAKIIFDEISKVL